MSGCDETTNAVPKPPIVVKKYANRRLYDTEASAYITLDDLAAMVRSGREFVVYDARTGDDITRVVLTQIIMEEETRGRSILPTSFLRQLISFYGDSLQGIVPEYLERMMRQFAAEQENCPGQPEVPRPATDPANAALIDRAARVFSPLVAVRQVQHAERTLHPTRDELHAEVASLRAELDRLGRAGQPGGRKAVG